MQLNNPTSARNYCIVTVALAVVLFMCYSQYDIFYLRGWTKPSSSLGPVDEICESPVESLVLVYNSSYGLCTTTYGRPIIWTFWDYKSMPAHVRAAVEALRCRNNRTLHIEMMTEQKFRQAMHAANVSIHPGFARLSLVHKTDYIRSMVLHRYGGMYTDLDAIPWSSCDRLFQLLLSGYDFVELKGPVAPVPGERLGGGSLLGPVRARSPIFELWRERVHAILDQLSTSPGSGKFTALGGKDLLANLLYDIIDNVANNSKTLKIFAEETAEFAFAITHFDYRWFHRPTPHDFEQFRLLENVTFPILRMWLMARFRGQWARFGDALTPNNRTVLGFLFNRSFQRCRLMQR